ncbi:tRNA uridine-5-carboxymethylaminomethyl(34) synthesis GTPase MnmE [Chelativorans sp. YIM 93263]|uniref:tRNA uridine-5-carboxymethylaminomethyl(34) synthesis GTPase MnmE n=1 Tax=Chelativorans sp. YIM 93263 TaxID=2906648 RepID=UPI0023782D97|nr:tRNA uridine-5-carboxymethylaminomethyl(34) synthesis GTPase MnmE [Chelativorans sp. YIM 93263]
MSDSETIFALSSGSLPSGIAVIRLSGPAARTTLESMTGVLPPARQARLSAIRDRSGQLLDRGLCLFFPGSASFTGEDCAELHLHGGRAVVASVLSALSLLPGLRAAEAGEFTKRAFLNGKIDLTGAEALSDLISAETEAQQRFALSNSSGRHRKLYQDWRQSLLNARALIEAELDFADESDVPGSVAQKVWQEVQTLRDAIAAHAAGYRNAEIIRDGMKVVIVGAPNAGKSSLLNALVQREAAIVTDEPGTTRDLVEVALDIGGMKILLTDTAGLRRAEGRVEAIGIERTLERAREADLVLLLEDVHRPVAAPNIPDVPLLRVGNKADRLGPPVERAVGRSEYDCLISAKTGAGLDALMESLRQSSQVHAARAGEILPFRLRHVERLGEAVSALDNALSKESDDLELRAEDLRIASHALGQISGDIDVEDLLDSIFATFCIGK